MTDDARPDTFDDEMSAADYIEWAFEIAKKFKHQNDLASAIHNRAVELATLAVKLQVALDRHNDMVDDDQDFPSEDGFWLFAYNKDGFLSKPYPQSEGETFASTIGLLQIYGALIDPESRDR